MYMFLHEIDNARIEWGDTLNAPKLVEGSSIRRFNVVVANPPFSLDKWGARRRLTIATAVSIAALRQSQGRLRLHFAHGGECGRGRWARRGHRAARRAFRGGAEGKIRQKLIEENLLEAVIGLPADLFFGTGIPAAILLFHKGRATTDVMFVDASPDFEQGKRQNKLRENDIEVRADGALRTQCRAVRA